MPFNGGGGGTLANHVHDNTPLQGGPLNFNNTTIAGMSAGDITYSDGNALQILSAPGVPAGEVLTFPAAATAPSWAAAGGAALELIDHTEAPVNTTTIDTTFTNIPLAGLSELYCITSGSNGGNVVGCQIYDQAGALLTGANYYYAGSEILNGVETLVNTTASTNFIIAPSTMEPHASVFHLMLGGASDHLKFEVSTFGGAVGGAGNGLWKIGGWYSTGGITGISGVKIGLTGSNSIERDTYLDIYKRSNA